MSRAYYRIDEIEAFNDTTIFMLATRAWLLGYQATKYEEEEPQYAEGLKGNMEAMIDKLIELASRPAPSGG